MTNFGADEITGAASGKPVHVGIRVRRAFEHMAVIKYLAILVGLTFCAGCGNVEKNTARQITGCWQLVATNFIEIRFGADEHYTMSNAGPILTTHITNVPVELRSLHLLPTQGVLEVVVTPRGTRLNISCISPNSGITMNKTVSLLDESNLVLQQDMWPPVHFVRKY